MIRTVLVGYGLAGKVFHAPLLQAARNVSLSKIVSTRKDEIKKHCPNVEVLEDAQEALKGSEELAVVATPNHTHFEIAKKALEAGKHVVVDKPLTPTLKQARELKKIAEANDRTLTVFHNRRFDGDFLTIQKLVEEKALGKFAYFESNFHRFRPEVNKKNWRETTDIAGGIFYDLAPHLLDQAIRLFGRPDAALADISTLREGARNDDCFHIILKYGNSRAHLNASALHNADFCRFILNGDKGSFAKKGMDPQEGRLKERPVYAEETGEDLKENYGDLKIGPDNHESVVTERGAYPAYYEQLAAFLTGNSEKPPVTLKDAMFVMELMEALLQSHERGRFVERGKDYDMA